MSVWTQSEPSGLLATWRKIDGVGEMAGWPSPADSRSTVRKAGQRIRSGSLDPEDIAVLNRWRVAHGYIINTFQATMRTRTRNMPIPVAQRLKRASTIIDKLHQGRALDLASMQDIAGIRIVFPGVESLNEFRAKSHQSRASHGLVNDLDKYDYLKSPKISGYRGIHDVYRYKAGTIAGAKWDGLLIEIQYRTLVQHAWATAVELSDVLTSNRTKFSQGAPDNQRFFQICSELLARRFEAATSCLADMEHRELVDEWKDIESRRHFFRQLQSVGQQHSAANLTGFVLLIVQPDGQLKVERQSSYQRAVSRLVALETEYPDWDMVLVSGAGDESLRSAFRNYFRNATEFVQMMEDALLPG